MTRDARWSERRKHAVLSDTKRLGTKSSSSSRDRHHRCDSVVDRFQALGLGEKLTTGDILNEFLPNQKCVLLATALGGLGVRSETREVERDKSTPLGVSRHICLTQTRKKKQRCPVLSPLVVDQASRIIPAPAQHPLLPYHDHAMKIWEDKIRRHGLSIEDAVYLLVREETVQVLESVLFLEAAQLDMAQMMEVEMTLDQLGGQTWLRSTCDGLNPHRRIASQALFESVWRDGTAFHVERKSIPLLQRSNNSPLKPLSPLRLPTTPPPLVHLHGTGLSDQHAPVHKSKSPPTPPLPPGNQVAVDRLRDDLQSSHKMLYRYGENVVQSSLWIQEHCVDEILRHRSPLFHASRKNQAAAVLMVHDSLLTTSSRGSDGPLIPRFARVSQNLLSRKITAMQGFRFRIWYTHMQEQGCREAIDRYCQLKAVAKILALARRRLRLSLFSCWQRWKRRQTMERKMERLASTVAIQSWMRCRLDKRRAKTYHLERAASMLQAAWRGYHCRKMLRRRRRFAAYSASAIVVQRAFRAHYNRCQFAIYWRRHKASRCITRSLRRYCARRRLFASWCARVARFHSAAVLQLWTRKSLARMRTARALEAKQMASALTLQRFFRYARFLLIFSSRVRRVAAQRHAAAVKLQNAYRSKIARARFYALKDQLEAKRRNEILEMMWNNAYATTIQRSWRKMRLQRKKPPPPESRATGE